MRQIHLACYLHSKINFNLFSCHVKKLQQIFFLKEYRKIKKKMTLPIRFIDELFKYLNKCDPIPLARLLNFKNQQYKDIYFKEEAKRYISEKFENSNDDVLTWSEVIEHYVLARNYLINDDYENAFESLSKSFKALIDLIKDSKDENWQLPVMYTISVDLRLIAYVCDSRKQQKHVVKTDESGANQSDEYAEKTAESLMGCFRNLCTDTRSDLNVSKRWGMM